ncbi:unnamed protein product [Thelazia callipaeda]|uniref:TIL domain-containing protein n=1 Tax=Thelazia callipaeda TaxID=103827 RepID=A0A0N5CYH6_THECL|nr:unnamed protein product [Thelazia callipaeda]
MRDFVILTIVFLTLNAHMPFVIPPSIPGSFSHRARDQPISDNDDEPKGCPPGCVDGPSCTEECKCQNTYSIADGMCNPPADSEVAKQCTSWYNRCPMYEPLHF